MGRYTTYCGHLSQVDTHLELNRYFADCKIWNETAIEARASKLLESALTIWSRPANTVPVSETAIKKTSASFYPECIRLAEDPLKTKLAKLSRTDRKSVV